MISPLSLPIIISRGKHIPIDRTSQKISYNLSSLLKILEGSGYTTTKTIQCTNRLIEHPSSSSMWDDEKVTGDHQGAGGHLMVGA